MDIHILHRVGNYEIDNDNFFALFGVTVRNVARSAVESTYAVWILRFDKITWNFRLVNERNAYNHIATHNYARAVAFDD